MGVSAFVTPRRDFGGTGWSTGVLEYWIWWYWICFYMKGRRRNIKIDDHPFLTSNAPILHHSITPWFFGKAGPPLLGEVKTWPFGPGLPACEAVDFNNDGESLLP
jgi:hypothetical protein